MPPKKGQLVKRRKTETADILAPQCWFKTDTDKNKDEQRKVLLILVARKKARASPFYYRKLPTDAFRTILAWIPTAKYCDKMFKNVTSKYNELKCKQYIMLERHRSGEAHPNGRLADVYYRLSEMAATGEKQRNALKYCIKYNPNHKWGHMGLMDYYDTNEQYEEFEKSKKNYQKLMDSTGPDKYHLDYFNARSTKKNGDYERGIMEVDDILFAMAMDKAVDDHDGNTLVLQSDLRDIKLECLIELKEWDRGIKLITGETCKSPISYALRSKCHFHKGNITKAIDFAAKAYKKTQKGRPYKEIEIALQLQQYAGVAAKKVKPEKIKWFF